MSLPTVKQLRYFLALVDHEHFSRAAAASFVSQSAFSAAIKEFERILGVRLVDRTNRQVTITVVGREVAAMARTCLADIEHLVESVQGQRSPLEGELHFGVIPTIAPFLLPAVLPKLRRAYPDLRLYLTEGQTQPLHEKLLGGELDVVLLALPYDLRGTDVLPLFDDPFLLAYRDKTRLMDPEHYKLSRLEPASVLLLDDGHCLREHALDACRLRNSDKLSPFSATSLLTLIEMVDADLGITYLPEMAVNKGLLSHTHVKTHPLGERSFRSIGLAWRKGSARAAEFALLGQLVIDAR